MAQEHKNTPGAAPGNNALRTAIAEDYTANMFKDGHNRTEENSNARIAPDYDRAAHTTGADDGSETAREADTPHQPLSADALKNVSDFSRDSLEDVSGA